MKKLMILAAVLLAILAGIAPAEAEVVFNGVHRVDDGRSLVMPGVYMHLTSYGEIVLEDRSGNVSVFDKDGQPISVAGERVFRWYDRTPGGAVDVQMLDGTWKLLDCSGVILYDHISLEWTDSGITACLIEAENRCEYLYFYEDRLVAQREANEMDGLHYLGVGCIYYEFLPDRTTRLWDAASGKEAFLPFSMMSADTVDARIGLQTGRAVLTSPLSQGCQTAFIDANLNLTLLDKTIYVTQDEAADKLYLLEYTDSGTVLYDARFEKELLRSEGTLSVWNGIITETTAQGCALYTLEGLKLFECTDSD